MKKSRISEPDVLQSADSKLQKNPMGNIPVFLVLGLCLLAVNIYSSKPNLFREDLTQAAAGIAQKYVWISGSTRFKEGLYLLTPKQLKEIFPDLLPLMTIASASPEFDSGVTAFQYKYDVPQPANLPPAVANIFFQPISLNRAEKEILSTLPGIGPKLAARIIQRRDTKGPFRSKEELLHITGIGPKKLAQLGNHLILD
jgi:competence ComEA-like helix-hairpin-helix protein